jgi:urease gamma subunit
MINVRATIRGEPDAPPFTKVFDYDEEIFDSSAMMVEEKIRHNMKINTNEALMAYCAYLVKSVRAGKNEREIQKFFPKFTLNNVMIGVPETLRAIMFEVTIAKKARKITIKEPIPTSSYVMAER